MQSRYRYRSRSHSSSRSHSRSRSRSLVFGFLPALVFFATAALAQAPAPPAPQAAQARPLAELRARDAIVLGLVEGITEYLPVSSTGHLIIATSALGLEDDTPLRPVDANGAPLTSLAPLTTRKGEPLSLKLAADTYTVVIQFGAILAVVFLYWRRILAMLQGLAGRNTSGFRLLRNVIIAVLPSAVIGLALQHYGIIGKLFSIQAVIEAALVGAVLMWLAERWRKKRQQAGDIYGYRDLDDLTPRHALAIGLMQCLALWPGMSRSMVTIVGGYFCRLAPAKAAEFSFLVGLPTLAGATLLKSAGSGREMIQVFGWSHVLLGCVVAAVASFFAVKFLVGFLTRHGLGVFALYRVLLACALAAWFLL